MSVPGLTEGCMVHYVLPDGQHRPAIVVRVWNSAECDGYINLQVLTDFSNDIEAFKDEIPSRYALEQVRSGRFWATSVCLDMETKLPGTWHWIEPA